jgi:hypothetical protein
VKKVAVAAAWILGIYLIIRGLAEPFTIDMSDPSTYRHDWGGPSLAGVLVVHMGPAIVSGFLMVRWIHRRRAQQKA